MALKPFFKKHARLAQFICPHQTATDVGVLKTWKGKECMVRQCDDCGLIFVNHKLFREPESVGMTRRSAIFDDG